MLGSIASICRENEVKLSRQFHSVTINSSVHVKCCKLVLVFEERQAEAGTKDRVGGG